MNKKHLNLIHILLSKVESKTFSFVNAKVCIIDSTKWITKYRTFEQVLFIEELRSLPEEIEALFPFA